MGHISINDERYYSLSEAAMAHDLDTHDLEYFCKNGLVQARKIANRWYIAESSLKQYAQGKEMPEPEVDEAEVKKVEALAASQAGSDPVDTADADETEYVVSPVVVDPPRRSKASAGSRARRPVSWRAVAASVVLMCAVGAAAVHPQAFAVGIRASSGAVAAVGLLLQGMMSSVPESRTPVDVPVAPASARGESADLLPLPVMLSAPPVSTSTDPMGDTGY